MKTGEETQLATDAVFIAVGYKLNTDIFKGQIDLDERGYVVAYDRTKTGVEGIFVAGDAHDFRYKQVVMAAGDGCKAAMDAEKYLEEKGI